jgi:hypothetical protein
MFGRTKRVRYLGPSFGSVDRDRVINTFDVLEVPLFRP